MIKESYEKGECFREGLLNLQLTHNDKIKDVRARGLMLALEFYSSVNVEEIHDQLLDNGFVVGIRDKTLRFMPPLTIKKSDIGKLCNAIDIIL